MSVRILIDSIVRQTTVLIAQLATSGAARAHRESDLSRPDPRALPDSLNSIADAGGTGNARIAPDVATARDELESILENLAQGK